MHSIKKSRQADAPACLTLHLAAQETAVTELSVQQSAVKISLCLKLLQSGHTRCLQSLSGYCVSTVITVLDGYS